MTTSLVATFAYVVVYFTLVAVLIAVVARRMTGQPREAMVWAWLGAFGLGHGLGEVLDFVGAGLAAPSMFSMVRHIVLGAAWIALLEFGRRGVRHGDRRPLGWWLYLPLLAVAAVGLLSGAFSGLETACRYTLAIPGAVLGAVALGQASRVADRGQRLGLGLAALALLIYATAIGLDLPRVIRMVGAPLALAGVGLYVGSWRPSVHLVGTNTRWAFAAALGLLAGAGWFVTDGAGVTTDAGMPQTVLLASAEAAEGTKAQSLGFEVSPMSRKDVTSQRLRAGIPVIAVTFLGAAVLLAVCVLTQKSWR